MPRNYTIIFKNGVKVEKYDLVNRTFAENKEICTKFTTISFVYDEYTLTYKDCETNNTIYKTYIVSKVSIGDNITEDTTKDGYKFINRFIGDEKVTSETIIRKNTVVCARF